MKKFLFIMITSAFALAQAAKLDVQPRNGMPLVEAEVDGVKCTLLADTGASHTTLDLNFVTNRLSGVELKEVELIGNTNVAMAPKFASVGKLKIGETVLEVDGAMALDLGHLSASVGKRVDGILGMNHIRQKPCLISLKRGEMKWDPEEAETEGFKRVRVRDRGNTYEILAIGPNGRRMALLVDTGSSFTFVSSQLWEAGEDEVKLGATDVNKRVDLALKKGKRGEIGCGGNVSLTIEPILSADDRHNQLGADVFKNVDILLKNGHLYLRF